MPVSASALLAYAFSMRALRCSRLPWHRAPVRRSSRRASPSQRCRLGIDRARAEIDLRLSWEDRLEEADDRLFEGLHHVEPKGRVGDRVADIELQRVELLATV